MKRQGLLRNTIRGILICILATSAVWADDRSLAFRIDDLIAAGFDGRQPAPMTDDAEFLRRI